MGFIEKIRGKYSGFQTGREEAYHKNQEREQRKLTMRERTLEAKEKIAHREARIAKHRANIALREAKIARARERPRPQYSMPNFSSQDLIGNVGFSSGSNLGIPDIFGSTQRQKSHKRSHKKRRKRIIYY
jgi:hypothetical protein